MKEEPRPVLAPEGEKLQREIKKLKAEALFIPLGFVAQIFNALCLLGLGFSVLLYFQRPQVVEQEKARLATESNSIGTLMINILQMPDKSARRKAIAALERLFPNHPQISDLAESDDNVASAENNTAKAQQLASAPKNEEARQLFCRESTKDLAALQDSIVNLNKNLEDERLGKTGNKPGYGPISVAIEGQIKKVKDGILDVQRTRMQNQCK